MADKGLKSNVVGLFGGTMLGISSVAPAYALTATLGLLAAAVAAKTPVVIIAGFLPMFFAAYAYREFNKVMPDAGTSFTWTSKAFGPYIGLLGGWAAVVACVIVLSNLAGVAVQFLYQFIGSAANSEMISGLWENKLINVVTCFGLHCDSDIRRLSRHRHNRERADGARDLSAGHAAGLLRPSQSPSPAARSSASRSAGRGSAPPASPYRRSSPDCQGRSSPSGVGTPR